MAIGSRCQRIFIRIVSPRQSSLSKLAAVVFLLVIGLLLYYVPTSNDVTQFQHHPEHPEQSKKDVVTEFHNDNLYQDRYKAKRKLSISIPSLRISTKMESTTQSRDQFSVKVDSRPSSPVGRSLVNVQSEEMEESKNRRHISKDGILSPKSVHIMPSKPVLTEGDPLYVSCAVMDMRSISSHDAPYLTFELPEMSYSLENEVAMTYRTGFAILKIENVKKGHEGTYRCVAVNQDNVVKYNIMEVRVTEKNDGNADLPVNETPLGSRQHPKFLERNDGLEKPLLEYDGQGRVDMVTLLERGKFQEQQVERFCRKYNLSDEATKLPPLEGGEQDTLFRHLLLNDKTKTMFCFVPKVGCTNLRVLFFISQGLIPQSQLKASRDAVNQQQLEEVQFSQSFLTRSNTQRNYALKHYYKFMMYRNPLERLVSGYRSKVERFPLVGLDNDKPHYNWLRKAVYLETHRQEYGDFVRGEGLNPVNVSFSDFVDYWLTQPDDMKIDEHFRTIFSVCQPCRIHFNFYGNFKDFNSDSQVLIEKIHSNPKFLRSGYYSNGIHTGTLTQHYYMQLTISQKLKIVELLRLDLDFYYHLFPDETDIHKSILMLT